MLVLLIFLPRVNATFREVERGREISVIDMNISIVADIGHRSSSPIRKIILYI